MNVADDVTVVKNHDPKFLDKILRMKPKQIEQYVAAQRRKHGTLGK
jgi:hypothetical protein